MAPTGMPGGRRPAPAVIEAAEEGQVVARPLAKLLAENRCDGRQGCLALRIARGNPTLYVHLQLLGAEWRVHFQAGARRQAEQVGVIVARPEGSGEQHGGAAGGEALGEKRRRHHVAQAQPGQAAAVAAWALLDVEQRMLAEQLGETAELQDREVELLQRRLQRLRLLGEQVVDRRHRVLQGQEQLLRWLVVGLVVVRLGLAQFVPGTLDTLQRFPQDLGAVLRTPRKSPWSSSAEYIRRPRSTRLCASSTSTATRHWLTWARPWSMAPRSK